MLIKLYRYRPKKFTKNPTQEGLRFGMIHAKKQCRVWLYRALNILFVFGCLSLLAPSKSSAESPIFGEKKTLTSIQASSWHSIASVPLTDNQFFAQSAQGVIYQVNFQQSTQQPLIDLAKYYPELISMSAFAIHPNFSELDTFGYYKIYTAHTQLKQKANRQNSSLLRDKNSSTYPLEVVVTEWQFTRSEESENLTIASSRALLSILIPQEGVTVAALTFSPFIKPWQQGFGYLHLGLSSQFKKHQHPLLTGSIIRINPQPFGLKAYSIPASNPFKFSSQIPDELYALGLGQFKQLLWVKDNVNQLIKVSEDSNTLLISKANIGTDARNQGKQTLPFAQLENVTSPLFYLKSSHLGNQNHPYVFLQTVDQSTVISSISSHGEQSAKILTNITDNVGEYANNNLLIKINDRLAILSLDHNTLQQTRSVKQEAATDDSSYNQVNQSDRTYGKWLLVLIGIIAITFIGIRLFNRSSKLHIRNLLHSTFADFTFDGTNQLHFYQRHEKTPSKSISLTEIQEVVLLLNGKDIACINKHSPFSNSAQEFIRLAFKTEKRDKMVDDKVREVKVKITLKNGIFLTACLYMRKGNVRLTKRKFFQIEASVIDSLWAFSKALCPDSTEQRLIVETEGSSIASSAIPENKPTMEPNEDLALSQTFEEEIESTQIQSTIDTPPHSQSSEKEQLINDNASTQTQDVTTNSHQKIDPPDTTLPSSDIDDVQLIESLGHLVELKEKGFLTEEEFKISKQRILQKLSGQ